MKLNEYLSKANDSNIKLDLIESLQKIYNVNLSYSNSKLFSFLNEQIFLEDVNANVFTTNQIINFTETDLGVDFITLRLVPLMNLFDGDFLVFDIELKMWCIYSISDNIKYDYAKDIAEVFAMRNS